MPQERDELLAAYAIGGLSDAEARAVEELIASDPEAERVIAEYHQVAGLIAFDAPLQRPDPLLRARVLDTARREGRPGRRRVPLLRTLAAAAVLAAFAVSIGWSVQLQGEVDTLREEASALQVAVSSDSRRIDVLDRDRVAGSEDELRAELQQVRDTHQRSVAILAGRDVLTAQLVSAGAGHGASGRFVWSMTLNAGVLIAQALPPLPLGTLYEVWLDDGAGVFSAGTFLPSGTGEAQVLVELAEAFEPRFVFVAPAPPGGAESLQPPIVLSGDITP